MDFLKTLFGDGESLTYEQLQAKVAEANMDVVNIADGSYVSRNKFNDTVNGYKQQVTSLTGQITQRDTDLADLNSKLSAAQNNAEELENARRQVTTLQQQYSTDKQDWESRLQQQQYESAVREKAGNLLFSSPAARRDFIRSVTEKGLQMDGETILGYDDFVAKYTTENPGAIVERTAEPSPTTPTPTITLPTTKPGAGEKSVFGFHFGGVRPHSADNN